MIAVAALVLMGLSVTEADAHVLRQAVEPRWAVAARLRPIELSYQRDPSQMVASTARADFAVDPAATMFMQAGKLKRDTQWDSSKGLAKSTSKVVTVGLALHW